MITRQIARKIYRRRIHGDNVVMLRSLFQDLNDLKDLLYSVNWKSLDGLNLYIDFLIYLDCKRDAWMATCFAKEKFPHHAFYLSEPKARDH